MELYNMKDEEYKKYIKGLCIANIPIDFYGLKINHIKVLDIFNMGEDEYKRTIYPMTLSKEVLLKNTNIDVNLLDLLTSDIYYDSLVKCLCMILDLKKEDIGVVSLDGLHNEIIINKFGVFITGHMFDQLKDIVLFINCLRGLTLEDLEDKHFKSSNNEYNERLAVFYKGKEEYDKTKENEDQNEIFNLCNFLIHIQSKIDYKNVLDLNIYQFYNSIQVLNYKEDYNFTRDIYSSGQISLKGVDIPKFYKIIKENKK